METLAQDLRYAVRALRKSPGFTAVAVLTLALGIGANTAVFSVVNAVLFQPLPYENPDRLVLLWNRMARAGADKVRVSTVDVLQYREQSRLFEDFAAVRNAVDAALTDAGDPERIRVAGVTANLFSLLGVEPVLGRTFVPEDAVAPPQREASPDPAPRPRPMILSHGLWARRYGGDRGILGRVLEVNGRPGIVVGVMPARFELLLPPDVGLRGGVDAWTPLVLDPNAGDSRERGLRDQDSDDTGAVIGRLKAGVTVAQAQAEMDRIAAWQRETSQFHRSAGTRIDVYPMHADVVAHARALLLALFGAVGFVLLIACINVANLLLARATSRRKEMALRCALGAPRARMVRQMLTESAVLAVFGGIAGVLLATWGVDLLLAVPPATLPRVDAIGVDRWALGFTLGATALAAASFGSAPALAAAGRGGDELLSPRDGGTVAGGRSRLGATLVVSEIALSLALLAGTGLMLKSFAQLQRVRPGFQAEGVLALDLTLRDPELYRGPADRARFVRGLEERLSALPGVRAVGLVGQLPLSGRSWSVPYGLEGQDPAEWSGNRADFRMITPGFFRAMGTRLLAGRTFTAEENLSEDRRVVIVDEELARRIAPRGNAIGARLGIPLDGRRVRADVVGVVERVRYAGLRADGPEAIYVPYRHEASRDVSLAVRTSGDPAGLAAAIRNAVHALDPALPVFNLRTMEEYVAAAVAPTRFAMLLMALFAGVAVVMASVGLYGLMSYTVGRQTREIGIRMALGARQGAVVRRTLGHGLRLAGLGLAAGLMLSIATSRVLSTLLYGISPTDPTTLAAVALLLTAVALLACYLPARRAARADPMTALRND